MGWAVYEGGRDLPYQLADRYRALDSAFQDVSSILR
jgi:hypothetical protein